MTFDSMFTGVNAILAGAIWGIVHALKTAFPTLSTSKDGQRLTPLLPLVLGVLGGLVGAVDVNPATMANKVTAGLMVGGLTMVVFKVVSTSVMGKGLDEVDSSKALVDPLKTDAAKPAVQEVQKDG